MKQTIGIDVGKAEVVIYAFTQYFVLKNDKKSLNAFLKEHRKALKTIDLIVFEATGGYERCLRDCLISKSLPYYMAHPNHVRDYAKSQGYIAKTDKIDAKVIGEYGAHAKQAQPEKPLPSEKVQNIKRWLDRREQLVKEHTRESNRLQQVSGRDLKQSIKRHKQWLKNEIKAIDAKMTELEKSDPELQKMVELVDSVPGVGLQTARAVVAYMPEITTCSEKTIAALGGLAPLNRDSGKYRGKRSIRGGRSSIRRVLYMAAMTAVRFNAEAKILYERLMARGKLYKVAITAVMRKLLLMIQAILKRKTKWIEKVASI